MKHLTLILMMLFFALPVFAQDAVPTVEATPAGDTVTIVPPAASDGQLIGLLSGALFALVLLNGVQFIVIAYQNRVMANAGVKGAVNALEILKEAGKLYPAESIKEIIAAEREKASKTTTPVDDIGLMVAQEVSKRIGDLFGGVNANAPTTATLPENASISGLPNVG